MLDESGVVAADGLTKTFGDVLAVSDLSFRADPGTVTGFLGPNGAGKTTTMRMLLGLATPTRGSATVGGVPYARLRNPATVVGAVLESTSFHPGRSALNHLRVYAAASGLAAARAAEVLAVVGLTDAARRPVRTFSLGMRQRLALATALLGDPRMLLLDEPANGLDPEGIVWLRSFLRHLAVVEHRTVLVSSHVLSEVEQTVDRVVIIARGRLVHQGTLDELRARGAVSVLVSSPTPDALEAALRPLEAALNRDGPTTVRVQGASAAAVGHAAWSAGVELHALQEQTSSLEQVFLEMTGNLPSAGGTPAREGAKGVEPPVQGWTA